MERRSTLRTGNSVTRHLAWKVELEVMLQDSIAGRPRAAAGRFDGYPKGVKV